MYHDYFPDVSLKVFIRAGMYVFFLKDWLRAFPRKQIFIQKAEDYYANRNNTLPSLFRFLKLGTR